MLVPGASAALEFDRGAAASGQWWRVLTGHLAHFGWSHFLWDALAFAFLGTLCERDGRTRFLACLALAGVAIPLCVGAAHPEIRTYRGLSGLDSALFSLLAATIVREKIVVKQPAWAFAAGAVFLAFLAKVAYEAATGMTFFVDSAAAGMIPLPIAHVAGAAAGLLVGFGSVTPSAGAGPSPRDPAARRASP